MSLLRRFIRLNQQLSARVEHSLLAASCVDGMSHYTYELLPQYLQPGTVVYDIGGGASPVLSLTQKQQLGLRYIGLDIAAEALAAAPAGCYDATFCGDIAQHRGQGEADLCICRAVLEHVPDVPGAFAALASILKPGGLLVLFVPCRNAPYARLALLLGERLKKRLLFTLFPDTRGTQGFPSYYQHCTPQGFRRLAAANGFEEVCMQDYMYSFYTSFFVPLHVFYRLSTLGLRRLLGSEFCEGFSLVLRKT